MKSAVFTRRAFFPPVSETFLSREKRVFRKKFIQLNSGTIVFYTHMSAHVCCYETWAVFLWCSKTLVPQQPAVLLFMFNWFSDISWFPLNRVDTPLKLNEKFRNNWLKRVHAVFVHYWHFSAKSFSGNWFRAFKKPRVIDYWTVTSIYFWNQLVPLHSV